MRKVTLVADERFDTEQVPAIYFDYAVEQWNNHHRECECLNCLGTESISIVTSGNAMTTTETPQQSGAFLFSLLVNSAMSVKNMAHLTFSLNISLKGQ